LGGECEKAQNAGSARAAQRGSEQNFTNSCREEVKGIITRGVAHKDKRPWGTRMKSITWPEKSRKWQEQGRHARKKAQPLAVKNGSQRKKWAQKTRANWRKKRRSKTYKRRQATVSRKKPAAKPNTRRTDDRDHQKPKSDCGGKTVRQTYLT